MSHRPGSVRQVHDESWRENVTVDDTELLARRFEAERRRLAAVAYRMLGSTVEAEDAVQETWIRLSRSETDAVDNLPGWLTTVVSRVCLDMLRSRRSRAETPLEPTVDVVGAPDEYVPNPEGEALLADAVGPALLVVLETLDPAERLAFVLHDLFAVPFDEIALIVGRSPAAARQLASRARRRVQGGVPGPDADRGMQRQIVEAFLAAARGGDFEALLALLDPDVVCRSDPATAAMGSAPVLLGPQAVAERFVGQARGARLAAVDGRVGAVWMRGRTPRVVFDFLVRDGVIASIELIADAETIAEMSVEVLSA